ncbi:MAG: TetR/AcrR family transcriptional regulator [Anaerolineales bacterium]|nr:TetR/AcrR family transcriptional regulator [Anaerolineales bacterium]
MRRGESTREKLLSETARLARCRGFSRTSVNTVLEATGMKKGALYHHFPGKDDLGLAVLARERDGFIAFLDGCLDASAPLASLENFFAAALKKHRDAGFVGGCLWGNTALEMGDSVAPHVDVVKRTFDDWIARIGRVIRAGQNSGEIRRDLPPARLACMVVAGIEGGIMLSRLTKQEGPLKTCLESLRAMLAEQGGPAAGLNPRKMKGPVAPATGEKKSK